MDITTYIAANVSHAGWKVQTGVILQAPAAVILKRINPAVGVVDAIDDESCALVARADNIEKMAVWIAMLDVPFRVSELPEPVAKLREIADRYLQATAQVPE